MADCAIHRTLSGPASLPSHPPLREFPFWMACVCTDQVGDRVGLRAILVHRRAARPGRSWPDDRRVVGVVGASGEGCPPPHLPRLQLPARHNPQVYLAQLPHTPRAPAAALLTPRVRARILLLSPGGPPPRSARLPSVQRAAPQPRRTRPRPRSPPGRSSPLGQPYGCLFCRGGRAPGPSPAGPAAPSPPVLAPADTGEGGAGGGAGGAA
mmetsp:Transcript_572/g.1698  ORF Transcript_572/g.1698 Transcript_572/m.1698 type:complete len:210 (+) Transcript_572:705-1334(+)